jgi:hypothetical protein
MNAPAPDRFPPSNTVGFDSPNCVDLVFEAAEHEQPAGPTPPELLKILQTEREKVLRWQAQTGQTCPIDQPASIDVTVDGVEWDKRVGPAPPGLLKILQAEREKLMRRQAQTNQLPPTDKPTEGIDPTNGAG